MSYQVKFTEFTDPSKPAITVEDLTLNQQTSLTFVGKNYSGWAPVVAENLLHLLENFAKNSPPANPVEGQLWYDNTTNVNLLKVFDGTTWIPTGSIKKATVAPLVSNSLTGDLWVDTDNQQLYIFSGSTWILIGPQFSEGLKTGPEVEVLTDISNNDHPVVVFYANNERITIVSDFEFTPKTTIPGFSVVRRGVNLTSRTSVPDLFSPKFWGTSSGADSLIINGSSVVSSNFLRSDATVPMNVPLIIRSETGLSIGSDLSFNLSIGETTTNFNSKTAGKSFEFIVTNDNGTSTVVHIDALSKVGIGNNNTNPQAELDVLGNVIASGSATIGGDLDLTGNLTVGSSAEFNGAVSFNDTIVINNLDANTLLPTAGSVILPGYTTSLTNPPLYDIGSETKTFRNVYAESFKGSFTGTVIGNLVGDITGSASKLASPTTFSLIGDVTSNSVAFNGQTQDGTLILETSISQDLITSKTLVTDSLLDDQFLIYRSSNVGTGVRRISKQTIISNIPTVPVGAIFPYAGRSAPTGYLLCDGSEVLISTYVELFNILGYTYRDVTLLVGIGTFALPDLRGRFPLGKDSMDNELTVETGDGNIVNAGGNRNGSNPSSSPANRVTDVTADNVGSANGSEYQTLGLSNLPDHNHSFATEQAEYYAGSLPNPAADPNATSQAGFSAGATTSQGIPRTGGVRSPVLGQAFTTMNPYQTINYIIFTGVL